MRGALRASARDGRLPLVDDGQRRHGLPLGIQALQRCLELLVPGDPPSRASYQHVRSYPRDTHADTCICYQAMHDVNVTAWALQTLRRRLADGMSKLPSKCMSHGSQQAQSRPGALQAPQALGPRAPLGVVSNRLHAAARLGQPADDGVQRHAIVPVRVHHVVGCQAAALVAQRARDARRHKVDGPAVGRRKSSIDADDSRLS